MAPKIDVEVNVIDKMSKELNRMNGQMAGWAKGVEGTFKGLQGGVFGIAVAASIGAITNQAIALGSKIDETSKKLSISTDFLQELDYAVLQAGGNVEAIAKSLGKVTVASYAAFGGNAKALESFNRLGVSVTDTNGSFRANEDVQKDVLRALANIPNATERAAAAQKLFGNSYMEVMPLLSDGAESIQRYIDTSKEMGQVLSGDSVAALDAAGDAAAAMGKAIGNMSADIVAQFAPALVVSYNLVTKLAAKMKELTEFLHRGVKGSGEITGEINERLRREANDLKTQIEFAERTHAKMVTWAYGGRQELLPVAKAELAAIQYGLDADQAKAKPPEADEEETAKSLAKAETARLKKLAQDKKYNQMELKALETMRDDNREGLKELWDFQERAGADATKTGYEIAKAGWDKQQEFIRQTSDAQAILEEIRITAIKDDGDREQAALDYKYKNLIATTTGNEAALASILAARGVEEEMHRDASQKRDKQRMGDTLSFTTSNLKAAAAKWSEFAGVYKAVAYAQAVWDTYQSANSAYASAAKIPLVGWVMGPLAGAAAVAAGLANAAGIASQNFVSGTPGAPAGWSRVGEQGPEDVYLPGGSRVYNSTQTTRNTKNQNTSITLHLYDNTGAQTRTLEKSLRSGELDAFVGALSRKMGVA